MRGNRGAAAAVLAVCSAAACTATEPSRKTLETVPIDAPPAPPWSPNAPEPPKSSAPLVTDEGGVEHCHCFGPESGGMKPECFGAVCRCYAAGKPLCPDGYIPGSALPCGEPGALHHTGEACTGLTDGQSMTGSFVCDPCGPWATPAEVVPVFLCVGSVKPGMRAIDAYGEWRCPSGKIVTPDRNAGFEGMVGASRQR